MKHTFFLLLLIFLSQHSCAQTDAHIAFANSFMEKVMAHDEKGIIQHMDKGYRKEQIAFLDGNTEQFVDELFGGTDVLTEEYVNIKFKNILRIDVAEVVDRQDGSFEYIFRVRDGQADVMSSLLLVTGKKMGFVGARG